MSYEWIPQSRGHMLTRHSCQHVYEGVQHVEAPVQNSPL